MTTMKTNDSSSDAESPPPAAQISTMDSLPSLKHFKSNLLVNILSFLPFEVLMVLKELTSHLWPFLGIEIALRERLDTVSSSFNGYLEDRRQLQVQQYMHHLQYCLDKVNAEEILSSDLSVGPSLVSLMQSPSNSHGIKQQSLQSPRGLSKNQPDAQKKRGKETPAHQEGDSLQIPATETDASTSPSSQRPLIHRHNIHEHRMRIITILRLLLNFKLPKYHHRHKFTLHNQEYWLMKPLSVRRISQEKARERKIRLQKKRLMESGATRYYVTPSVYTGQRSSNYYSFNNNASPASNKRRSKKKRGTPTHSTGTTNGLSTASPLAASNLSSPSSSLRGSPSSKKALKRTPRTSDNLLDKDLELLLSHMFEHCSSLYLLENSINEEKLEFILPYVNSLTAVNYTDIEPIKSYRYVFLWILAVLDFRRHLQLYAWYFHGADMSMIQMKPHAHILGSTTIQEENHKGCLHLAADNAEANFSPYSYRGAQTSEQIQAEEHSAESDNGESLKLQNEHTTDTSPSTTTITLPTVQSSDVNSSAGDDDNSEHSEKKQGKSFSKNKSGLAIPKLQLDTKLLSSNSKKGPHSARSVRGAQNGSTSGRKTGRSENGRATPRGKELFPPSSTTQQPSLHMTQEPQKALPMSARHKYQHMSKEEYTQRKIRRQKKLVDMEKKHNNVHSSSKKKKSHVNSKRRPLRDYTPMRPVSRLQVLLSMSSNDNSAENVHLTPKRIETLVEKKLHSSLRK